MGQSIRGEIEANANNLSMEDALLKGDETNAMFFHLHWTIEACDGFSRCSDLLGWVETFLSDWMIYLLNVVRLNWNAPMHQRPNEIRSKIYTKMGFPG